MASVGYDDGLTPNKQFLYDTSAPWSITQSNLRGRMSVAQVNPPSVIAGTAFSYDVMGRAVQTASCTPSGCGTSTKDKHLAYTFDWLGNILTSTDGNNVQTSYSYTVANEVSSVTSSLTGGNYVSALVSNVQQGPTGPLTYYYGNSLSQSYSYDTLGRQKGGSLCPGAPSTNCAAAQYGFYASRNGNQIMSDYDTVTGQNTAYGYDEFERISSSNYGSGTKTYAYTYDRYGNRWAQNAPQGGPAPNVSFDAATNRINSAGYQYDAVGNMINDGFHTYTYDAEGNVLNVNGGSVAKYVYDALNQRVRVDTGSVSREFIFNLSGQRVSTWDGNTGAAIEGNSYFGAAPLSFYSGRSTHFQHQGFLGTERVQTSNTGAREGTYFSLAFGDGYTSTGSNQDAYHYAGLDHDTESATDHALFRQYSPTQGRWLRPDPYLGSYDFNNPQSMNRYAYAGNTPFTAIDPSGLLILPPGSGRGGGGGFVNSSNTGFGSTWGPFDIFTFVPYDAIYDDGICFGCQIVFGGLLFGGFDSRGFQNSGFTISPSNGVPGIPHHGPVTHSNPVPPGPINPCAVLAVASVPLAATGIPEVAIFLELSAGAAR